MGFLGLMLLLGGINLLGFSFVVYLAKKNADAYYNRELAKMKEPRSDETKI